MVNIITHVKDDAYVIKLIGDMDHLCDRKKIKQIIKRGSKHNAVHLDMSEVEFAGSVLIDILMSILHENKDSISLDKFYLLNPSVHIIDLLTVTNHINIFNVIHNVKKKV